MSKALQQSLFDKLEGSYWLDSERYFACYCPFDDHEKPALLCYDDGWTCLSCNKSGSLEYLQSKLGTLPTRFRPKANKKQVFLPRWRQWEKRYGNLEDLAEAAHQNLLRTGATYYKTRKLDMFVEQGKFGLLDGWATTPVFDRQGNVIDIVVRAIRQEGVKYVVRPTEGNEPRPLYVPNWKRCDESDIIRVVYGIYTVWSLEYLELPGITGVTGKSLNSDIILRNFPNKRFIIIPDHNEERAAYKLQSQIGWQAQVHHVNWEYGISDLDDYRRKRTKEELRRFVEGEKENDWIRYARTAR